MASQPGQKTIAIYILPNISRSKGKTDDKIWSVKRIYAGIKNHAENEEGRLVPCFFLFIKKALYEVKGSDLQFIFNLFFWLSTCHSIKYTV